MWECSLMSFQHNCGFLLDSMHLDLFRIGPKVWTCFHWPQWAFLCHLGYWSDPIIKSCEESGKKLIWCCLKVPSWSRHLQMPLYQFTGDPQLSGTINYYVEIWLKGMVWIWRTLISIYQLQCYHNYAIITELLNNTLLSFSQTFLAKSAHVEVPNGSMAPWEILDLPLNMWGILPGVHTVL